MYRCTCLPGPEDTCLRETLFSCGSPSCPWVECKGAPGWAAGSKPAPFWRGAVREGAQGGPREKGTQPGNGVWFFSFRPSYRRAEKKPARVNRRSKQAAVHRSWQASWGSSSEGGKGGACASSVAGELDAGCPCPVPRPRQEDLQRGRGGIRTGRPGRPTWQEREAVKGKEGVQPGPALSRLPGASPLRKMRGKSRKESLSDSRDLDGSYDQLTGEFPPNWQRILLRAAALAWGGGGRGRTRKMQHPCNSKLGGGWKRSHAVTVVDPAPPAKGGVFLRASLSRSREGFFSPFLNKTSTCTKWWCRGEGVGLGRWFCPLTSRSRWRCMFVRVHDWMDLQAGKQNLFIAWLLKMVQGLELMLAAMPSPKTRRRC